jgi:precorrin-4/cobalt-precorrin-4 C11-methyltransferase
VISFVGAGPGAADLITLRGHDRLAGAEVVIWASSLVPAELLGHAPATAVIHDSAAMTLEDVLAVYAAHDDGARIVRLHSGDPALYGAIREQLDWCAANRRTFEIVPGVSSFSAAAAALERELTVPRVSQSLVITRLAGRTEASMPEREGVLQFAAHGSTMAVFLSGARPAQLQAELLDGGYPPETPAAVVVRVSWPDEQIVRTTVGELASTMGRVRATRTVLVLVGDALGDEPAARSHLYSPAYAHAFRRRSAPGSTVGRRA